MRTFYCMGTFMRVLYGYVKTFYRDALLHQDGMYEEV